MSDYARLQEENAVLKAEIERLTAEVAEANKPKAAPVKAHEPEPPHKKSRS